MKSGVFITHYLERGRRIAQEKFAGKISEYNRSHLITTDGVRYTFANIKNMQNTRGMRLDEVYLEEDCPLNLYLDVILPCLKSEGKVHLIRESEQMKDFESK